MGEISSGSDLFNELAHEFAERYRRGERPSLSEYADRYPHLAEEIRELFPMLAMMERAGSDADGPRGSAAARPRRDGPMPERLGDYRILREIGRGGMGVVYEAVQESLGRHIALKVLSPDRSAGPVALARFQREAKIAALLHHTNVVPVFGVGEHEGVWYYAMQYIRGRGLDAVLREVAALRRSGGGDRPTGDSLPAGLATGLMTGRYSDLSVAAGAPEVAPPSTPEPDGQRERQAAAPSSGAGAAGGDRPASDRAVLAGPESRYFREVARMARQAAEALAYAHDHGVIHRDIKPSNLLLDVQGTIWVTDFGLAKAEGGEELTRPGDVIGTLRYLAPERFKGQADARSDIYGLGMTLYELLMLEPAFRAGHRVQLMHAILHEEPARPRQRDRRIPRDLETIVLKAIAKDPADRFGDAGAMAAELGRFLEGRPIRSRRLSIAERVWRWSRRNPALAALAASVLVLLVAVAVVTSVGYVRTSVALSKVDEQRRAAEHERELARRLLYDADMQLAARLWQSDTVSARVVAELLEAHVPRPGEDDLRDFTWRYQWRLLHDPPPFKPANPILTVAGAPGGDVLTYDGSLICWWDKVTHRETRRRSPAALPNRSCCRLSPGGTLLALGTSDGSLDLYDTATDQQRPFLRGAAPLRAVCFSPDGRTLATIHTDRRARAWEIATGRELATFALRPASGTAALSQTEPPFEDCALESDGRTLALAGHPDHLQVALYRAGRADPEVLQPGSITVSSVVFSPDGHTIASGDSGGGVDLWDAAAGRHRDRFSAHIDILTTLAFSLDGTLLGAGGHLGFVSVWALARRERASLFKGPTGSVTQLAFGADGKSLVSVGEDGAARLWDLTEGAESRTLLRDGGWVPRVAYSPDGRWLAAAPAGALALWDARTGVLVRRLGFADSAAFSPDGRILAVGGEDSSRVVLWDLETGRRSRAFNGRPRELDRSRRIVGRLAFSPDGRWLAAGFGHINWFTGDYDQVVKVWDLTSGQEAAALPHRGTVPSLAFSPDGEMLATACHDGTLRLWAVGSWRLARSWKGSHTFDALAFGPGGRTLATGSGDGSLHLWDVATGRALREFGRHSNRTFDVAFSPDGKTLASASADHSLRLWDVVSGRELRTLAGHTDWVLGVAFAPGGDALASCGADGTVRLWDSLDRAEFLSDWLSRDLQPDDAHARIDRARAYLALKQPDEALAEATRAVELQPESLAVRQARGEIYLGLRKWAEAQADYSKVGELEPGDVRVLALHAELSARCEKWADAADDFAKLMRMETADSPPAWYLLCRRALALLASGQQGEYRKVCAEMVDRFQTTADTQTAFFTAWTSALRPDAVPDLAPVLRLAEKAGTEGARNARSHQAVGAVLYRMGRFEECFKQFDAAEAADNPQEQNSPAYWHYFRAMAHHRLGHKEAARNWLAKAAAETEKELRDVAQGTSPGMWVRQATLDVLRTEAQALVRETAAKPEK